MPPRPHAQLLHRIIPRSRLEVLDGIGHMPFFEDPTAYRALVDTYVRQLVLA
jgi:pimeloyl-ACP methyl ester carboxylesterase